MVGLGKGVWRIAALGLALTLAAPAQARQEGASQIYAGHAAYNAAVDTDAAAKSAYNAGHYLEACNAFGEAAHGMREAERLLREAETHLDGDGDRKIISEIVEVRDNAVVEEQDVVVACQAARDYGQMK